MIGNYIGAPIGGVINTDTGNTGFLAVTLDDAALSSTGAVAIAGQAPVVLDAAVLSATGALAISGTSSITLDDVSLAATGALGIAGTEGTLLDDVTLSATIARDPQAILTVVLDDVTLVATAHVAARVLARIGDGGYANTPATISGKRTIVMAGANIGRTSARGSSLTHLTAGGGRL
jgi:hypothetical protein